METKGDILLFPSDNQTVMPITILICILARREELEMLLLFISTLILFFF